MVAGEEEGAEDDGEGEEEEEIVKKKKRYYPKKRPVVKAEGKAEGEAKGGGDGEEGGVEAKKPRRKKYDGPVFGAPKSLCFVVSMLLLTWHWLARQRCDVQQLQRGLRASLHCISNKCSDCKESESVVRTPEHGLN